jgi:hypothetical protein
MGDWSDGLPDGGLRHTRGVPREGVGDKTDGDSEVADEGASEADGRIDGSPRERREEFARTLSLALRAILTEAERGKALGDSASLLAGVRNLVILCESTLQAATSQAGRVPTPGYVAEELRTALPYLRAAATWAQGGFDGVVEAKLGPQK